MVRNHVFHECTNHIKLVCHFIRSKLTEGFVSLHHVSTSARLADVFTKPLTGVAYNSLLLKLGVLSPSNLGEGGGGVGLPHSHAQCRAPVQSEAPT